MGSIQGSAHGGFGPLGENAPNKHIFTFFGGILSLNRRVIVGREFSPPQRIGQFVELVEHIPHGDWLCHVRNCRCIPG